MIRVWRRLGNVDQLAAEGFGTRFETADLRIAVFRWNGTVFALEDFCPHEGFPLSEGSVRNGEVICPRHGWHVRLADGGCPVSTLHALSFPVELRDGGVWIQVPAPDSESL